MRRRKGNAALELNSASVRYPCFLVSAALNRCSTIARYSSLLRVPSLSGSAAAKSLRLSRNRPTSLLVSVPVRLRSSASNLAAAAFLISSRSTLPSPLLSIAWNETPLAARAGLLKPSSTVVATHPIAARLDSIRSTPKSVGTRRTANLINSRPRGTSGCQHHLPPLPHHPPLPRPVGNWPRTNPGRFKQHRSGGFP